MGCLFSKLRRRESIITEGDSDEDRYKFIYGNPLNSRPNILTLTSQFYEEPCDGGGKIHI
jgi:hypothetical protein